MVLSGNFQYWVMFDRSRCCGQVVIPYKDASRLVVARVYNALTGEGEQREIMQSHKRKLKREMQSGNFTPTAFYGNLLAEHRKNLVLDEKKGTFKLTISDETPLARADGNHRIGAIAELISELRARIEKEQDKGKVLTLRRWLQQLLDLPMTFILFFDGDTRTDFTNLQKSRSVDGSHMASLQIAAGQKTESHCKAHKIATILHERADSPFRSQIKFDSRGRLPLPFSSLCLSGSSDQSTSLLGLVKVAPEKDPEWLADCICSAFNAIKADSPGLLEYGKYLTPFSDGGSKGSATMVTGLGICLAYAMQEVGEEIPKDELLQMLVGAAEAVLDVQVNGNFSGPVKRTLCGAFAKNFFGFLECETHEGVPLGLVQALSASAYGLGALPKTGRKKKSDVSVIAQDENKPAPWEDPLVVEEVMG